MVSTPNTKLPPSIKYSHDSFILPSGLPDARSQPPRCDREGKVLLARVGSPKSAQDQQEDKDTDDHGKVGELSAGMLEQEELARGTKPRRTKAQKKHEKQRHDDTLRCMMTTCRLGQEGLCVPVSLGLNIRTPSFPHCDLSALASSFPHLRTL